MRALRRRERVAVPDTAEGLLPATEAELQAAAKIAAAVHDKVQQGAKFEGLTASMEGETATLEQRGHESFARAARIVVRITQNNSGTWWVAREETKQGTEIDAPMVRRTTEYPLAADQEVVNRTESSNVVRIPFERDPAMPMEETSRGPLSSRECQSLVSTLGQLGATAIMPEPAPVV